FGTFDAQVEPVEGALGPATPEPHTIVFGEPYGLNGEHNRKIILRRFRERGQARPQDRTLARRLPADGRVRRGGLLRRVLTVHPGLVGEVVIRTGGPDGDGVGVNGVSVVPTARIGRGRVDKAVA